MPLPAPAPLRSSRGQKGNCAVCPSSQLCLLWNPSLGKGQQSVAPTGQRKAHRNTNQEGSQTVEAAAPPAHYEPYEGGGRLRHPSFHSGAGPASQGISEADPGGPAPSVFALFGDVLSLFPRPVAVA